MDVYDQQTVGIFLTLTLGADNAGALTDSLTAWGYLHDANRETVEEALQFYIDKSWYFVAMRIDSSGTFPQRPGGYWYGPIDPIRLTFETAEPIYPLRISAISARDPTEVLLYVCASHRTIFDGAKTEYANWFSESELRAVESDYLYLSDVMDDSCFMTKLRRSFSPDEMTDDLILERAPTDREFREIRFVGIPLADGLMVAMLGGLGLTSRRLRRRGRT